MSRPTNLAHETPLLDQRIGSELPNPLTDTDDPTDRAAGIDVFVPSTAGLALVQSKIVNADNSTASITATLDAAPQAGNLLIALVSARNAATLGALPSGWATAIDVTTTSNGGPSWLLYKVAGASEAAGLTITLSNYKRLVVAEFSGVNDLDEVLEVAEQSASTSYSVGSITPTDSAIVFGFVNTVSKPNYTTNASWTAIDEDGLLPTSAGDGPSHHFAYRIVSPAAATTFQATSDSLVEWCGGIAAFVANAWLYANGGPAATDGDDATYVQTSGTVALLIDLGDAYPIASAAIRIGTQNSGSRTYTLEGAAEADFSDAVVLDSVTFSATGSYTAQDIAMSWTPTTDYRYFRLTGNDETRRIYSFELYEPTLAGSHEHDEYIPKSIVDAAGDIIYATAADTVARLARSSNANSLQSHADGTLEWGMNVRRLSANGSNYAMGPDVNLISGSNIILAVSSNAITITATGAGAGGGAPTSAEYVTYASNVSLSAERVVTTPATGGVIGKTVRKTTTETVNNSAALQDDDHLLVALGASEVWEFEANLWYDSGTTPDLKVAFTFPAGATCYWTLMGVDGGGTAWNENNAVTASDSALSLFGAGAGTVRHGRIQGVIANGGTPGNLQLRWAQNTANASDTKLLANSVLRAWQIA